jgi:hypothetical protein
MYSAEAWMSEAVDHNFHSRSKDFRGVRATTSAPHNLCPSPFFCSTPTFDNCFLSKRHHKPSSAVTPLMLLLTQLLCTDSRNLRYRD